MKFSYNWLQSFFKEKLPEPKKLAELITFRLFEVEEIEKIKNDWIIDIDVLPNRAGDCFSHIGIAKEISAILGKKMEILKPNVKKDYSKNKKSLSLEIKNKKDCPRYTVAIIKGVKIKPSPLWIKEKLEICGIQSINNIVDIVNYAMLETGQPMHAFDFNKIKNKKIIVRKAKENEKTVSLDNKKYSLNKNILVISDSEKVLGIAGIKGCKNAEIDNETTDLALESANFDRLIIRKGSNELKLRTDASLRFEHGLSPDFTEKGILRAIDLIHEIAGGNFIDLIDFYPVKTKKKKIKLDLNYLNRLLGIEIKTIQIKKILESLQFKVLEQNQKKLEIEIPNQRTDVEFQEDLIEEIGRINGYEKIKPSLPESLIVPPKESKEFYWGNKSKEILKNLGFVEIYNYSFVSEEQANIFGCNLKTLVEVEKPASLEQKYLRPDLIIHLLKNIKENEKFFKEIKIFELGKTFRIDTEKINEKEILAGLITGDSFYDVKSDVELLLKEIGVNEVSLENFFDGPNYLHFNKKAKIVSKLKQIGFMGNISFKTLGDLKIKSNLCAFVIDFDQIKKMASEEKYYRPIPKFPAVERDLSILVPEREKFESVLKTINNLDIKLIKKIDFLDFYQGKGIPDKKKNLTLRLEYRDDMKTLTSEEVNKLHQKVIRKIEDNKNWKVRK